MVCGVIATSLSCTVFLNCSATWPPGVRRLAESYMSDPFLISVGTLDLKVHCICFRMTRLDLQCVTVWYTFTLCITDSTLLWMMQACSLVTQLVEMVKEEEKKELVSYYRMPPDMVVRQMYSQESPLTLSCSLASTTWHCYIHIQLTSPHTYIALVLCSRPLPPFHCNS